MTDNNNIIAADWHLGHAYAGNTDTAYDVPWGHPVPPLRAYNNVSYMQFISIIKNLWEKAHPELCLVPMGNRAAFDPERGYVVYHLDNKKPSDGNMKPIYKEDIVETDSGKKEGAVFTQSFDHLIRFTVVHKDPDQSEAIMEAFEDFMIVVTPQLGMVGVEKLFYNRRISDRDETRFGDDISTKAVQYLVTLQRLLFIKSAILESVRIDVRLLLEEYTAGPYSIMYVDIDGQANPPLNFIASRIDDETIGLSWLYPEPSEGGGRDTLTIQVTSNNGFNWDTVDENLSLIDGATPDTYTYTHLVPGVYRYRIKTVNDVKDSEWVESDNVTLP